jgi:hypothetical protein
VRAANQESQEITRRLMSRQAFWHFCVSRIKSRSGTHFRFSFLNQFRRAAAFPHRAVGQLGITYE